MQRAGIFVLAAAALTLSACVSAPPVQELAFVYTDEEFGRYAVDGDATVTGQAFLRQRGGGVVVCAGAPVVLFPKTPTFDRAVETARAGKQPMPAAGSDERFKKVARIATCDAQGNFTFERLPRARWYVFSRVTWEVADSPQGGELVGEVDTSAGGEHRVLLTDANRVH
ncbi:MAG: hypothetical protein KDJ43_09915 [Rhizobiaceae bacterium]|nr:hypothetical protein [Rhizobiaceae bacterium]